MIDRMSGYFRSSTYIHLADLQLRKIVIQRVTNPAAVSAPCDDGPAAHDTNTNRSRPAILSTSGRSSASPDECRLTTWGTPWCLRASSRCRCSPAARHDDDTCPVPCTTSPSSPCRWEYTDRRPSTDRRPPHRIPSPVGLQENNAL